MLQIECSGAPRAIGFAHGSLARERIMGSLESYAAMFQRTAGMTWSAVQETALSFHPIIAEKWPEYLDEMAGVAEGAGVPLEDILALNVRTEIAFGLARDGCTAVAMKSGTDSFLGQNWDWEEAQKANLILLSIRQQGKPWIKMITEAGIIGKIGINSAGVGVTLNAIRVPGMDNRRLPCHLALRMVLDSTSMTEAVSRLERYGVAASCHFLIADADGSVGLEWSASDVQRIEMDQEGRVLHTNHFLVKHPGVEDIMFLKDSPTRFERARELCDDISKPSFASLAKVFRDENNLPAAICRQGEIASLFNIVMDLRNKTAKVVIGRPTEAEEELELRFDDS